MRACDDYKTIITSNFPLSVQQRMVQSVQLAYSTADQLIEEIAWLNWPVGIDHLGYLRNIAVEHALFRMMTNMHGLECHIRRNERKNFEHIEICSKNCILTICQVHSPYAFPRKAIYRKNLSSSNQLVLDYFQDEKKSSQEQCDEFNYLILTHGCRRNQLGQPPSFIGIGFPNVDGDAWHDFIDLTNLMKQTFIVTEDATAKAEEALKIDLRSAIDIHILKKSYS